MPPIVIKLNKFRNRSKIAAFDFDWTLVRPKTGGTFPKDADDWEWLRPSVPKVLKHYYDKGYSIFVFTNQTKDWKKTQIENALSTLDIPICVCIAFDKTIHKPNPEMFHAVVPKTKFNPEKSFFVGDALGRPNDWSDSDKKFAENIGISIVEPEDIFPFEKADSSRIKAKKEQEIIIMVGYPGSGKSTISEEVFHKAGYVILHGDELKTSKKMISQAKLHIKDGKSIVFDATNPSKKKRAEYIEFANNLKIPVRCVHVATSMEESLSRNNKRPEDKIIPKIAFYLYRKHFEEPSSDEGCTVVTIGT
jgi:bifunctional polynucleotide phosphatase/kinase